MFTEDFNSLDRLTAISTIQTNIEYEEFRWKSILQLALELPFTQLRSIITLRIAFRTSYLFFNRVRFFTKHLSRLRIFCQTFIVFSTGPAFIGMQVVCKYKWSIDVRPSATPSPVVLIYLTLILACVMCVVQSFFEGIIEFWTLKRFRVWWPKVLSRPMDSLLSHQIHTSEWEYIWNKCRMLLNTLITTRPFLLRWVNWEFARLLKRKDNRWPGCIPPYLARRCVLYVLEARCSLPSVGHGWGWWSWF